MGTEQRPPPAVATRRRRSAGALLVASPSAAVALLFAPGEVRPWAVGALSLLGGAIAVVAGPRTGRAADAWRRIGIGLVLWSTGLLLVASQVAAGDLPVPSPSFGEAVRLLGLLVLVAGLVTMASLRLERADWIGRIDAVLATGLERSTNLLVLDSLLAGNWPALGSSLLHLVLPVTTLGLVLSGVFLRLTRINVIETLQLDFVAAARARGIRERAVVYRHALGNALIPVITLFGLQVAILLAGAVLTETVFSWPGMGLYLVQRIAARDYTAVQSVITVFAVFVALISLAVDIVYSLVDPRVRYG